MILLDSHVHIYPCYPMGLFWKKALANFKSAAARFPNETRFTGCLLLAESVRFNSYAAFREYALGKGPAPEGFPRDWKVFPLADRQTLYLSPPGETGIYLMAGRQIVSQEGLEVLALCTDVRADDGLPVKALIDRLSASDILTVLPWSPGKWLGARGKYLREIIREKADSGLFLGDIRQRPVCWPRPAEFELASRANVKILCGTDPLPLGFQAGDAGSFGNVVFARLDGKNPALHLKALLRSQETRIADYGQRIGAGEFMKAQLGLRLKKQSKRRP